MVKDNTKGKYIYQYPHPAMTADCVVFSFDEQKLKVLLIQRGVDPYKGKWAFPGGFMKIDETIEECARRELMEETGMELDFIKQMGVFSKVDRDPRERVVTVAFYALAPWVMVSGGDDASDAQWFPVDEVPPLAFDHWEILCQAMERIREDIHFEPIGFDLMGEEFSIGRLQRLYESILGVKFDRRNFVRKMMATGILQEVPSRAAGNADVQMPLSVGRPGRKYRFDKEKYEEMKRGNAFRLEF